MSDLCECEMSKRRWDIKGRCNVCDRPFMRSLEPTITQDEFVSQALGKSARPITRPFVSQALGKSARPITRPFAIFVQPDPDDDQRWLAHVVGADELDHMTQGHDPISAVFMASDLLLAVTDQQCPVAKDKLETLVKIRRYFDDTQFVVWNKEAVAVLDDVIEEVRHNAGSVPVG